jgi:L,D-transpeptidase ErfK/SrfK
METKAGQAIGTPPRRAGRGLWLAALAGLAAYAAAQEPPNGDVLVGGEFSYTVKEGDSLALVGARFGVAPPALARSNGLPSTAWLRIGQILRVDNRHVVPFFLEQGILINVPQRLLFFFQERRLVTWYAIGVGRRDWPTAGGRFQIRVLERRPTWNVPLSIQEEMRRGGEKVETRVPPGPDNPLGDYWIGLEGSECGIHGTNAPASIYGVRTHGCMRLHPDDIADLFPRVSKGMTVQVVYEPVLLARAADGAVFLEVNPDVYGRQTSAREAVASLAERENPPMTLDPDAVERTIAGKEGLAPTRRCPGFA